MTTLQQQPSDEHETTDHHVPTVALVVGSLLAAGAVIATLGVTSDVWWVAFAGRWMVVAGVALSLLGGLRYMASTLPERSEPFAATPTHAPCCGCGDLCPRDLLRYDDGFWCPDCEPQPPVNLDAA